MNVALLPQHSRALQALRIDRIIPVEIRHTYPGSLGEGHQSAAVVADAPDESKLGGKTARITKGSAFSDPSNPSTHTGTHARTPMSLAFSHLVLQTAGLAPHKGLVPRKSGENCGEWEK